MYNAGVIGSNPIGVFLVYVFPLKIHLIFNLGENMKLTLLTLLFACGEKEEQAQTEQAVQVEAAQTVETTSEVALPATLETVSEPALLQAPASETTTTEQTETKGE